MLQGSTHNRLTARSGRVRDSIPRIVNIFVLGHVVSIGNADDVA